MSKIIYLDKEYINRDEGNLIVVLGNFDGFHIGHMSLFNEAVKIKEEHGGVTSAIIFDASAAKYLGNGKSLRYITPLNEKVGRLEDMGIDVIYIIHMSKEFLSLTKDEFLDFLKYSLHPASIVVGEDYSFGYKAKGRVKDLQEAFGDSLHVMELIKDKNGNKFSTQAIIKLIEEGKIEEANEDLITPYSIIGKVVKGKQNGRTIGFPTANIELADDYVIPKEGVYTGEVCLDNGEIYQSLINVGKNPTISLDNKETIEAYLDGFEGDLYDRYIQVSFLAYIRDEHKFNSLEDLKKQLQKDVTLIK